MTALFIILGIAALITVILRLFIRIYFTYDGTELVSYVKLGPLKAMIIPSPPRKLKFRKTAKFLRTKKLSKAKKRGKAKHLGRTGDTLDDLISQLSETAKNPEITRLSLRIAKLILLYFRYMIRVELFSVHIGIDTGDAAGSCIACGAAYQVCAYIVEFLNVNTILKPVEDGVINICPVFNDGKSTFDISGRIRIRLFNVIRAVATSAFRSAAQESQKIAALPARKDMKK